MGQTHEITTTGATYLELEASYNVDNGSPTRVYPRNGGTHTEDRATLAVDTQQVHQGLRDTSVTGLATCGSSMTFDVRAPATQADAASTPTRSWLGIPLVAGLGGESIHAGSLVTSGSTSTVINVTTGQGSRFNVNDFVMIGVGGVPEVGLIKSITGDALTLYFALSAAPAVGQVVLATESNFFTDQSSRSVTFRRARAQNSASQWQHRGCIITGLSLDLTRGALMSLGVTLAGASWQGPAALGYSTAHVDNPLPAPFANVGGFTVFQPIGTTTRPSGNTFNVQSMSLTLSTGMELQEDQSVNEGNVGPMRTSMSANGELVIRHDPDYRTNWDPSAVYQLVHWVYSGSGATRRGAGFALFCTIEENPSFPTGSNNRGQTRLGLRGIGGRGNSAVATDQARSPFIFGRG